MFEQDTMFRQFFLDGGPIVWFVLLPMSVIMLCLVTDLLFRLRRSRLLPAGRASEIATLAGRHGAAALNGKLADAQDLLGKAFFVACARARKKGFPADLLRQYVVESLQEQGLVLLRRADGCHLIGTVAPMVGLFGTVFGMIKAFTILGLSGGQPRPDQLASAISVALVTTFWGLLAAIPALFAHGFFRTRIESLLAEAASEAEALTDRLLELGRLQPKVQTAAGALTSHQTGHGLHSRLIEEVKSSHESHLKAELKTEAAE